MVWPRLPAMPAMELIDTMRPPSPMAPSATSCSLMRSWLAMLMFITMSQWPSGMLPSILSRVTPALCTRISRPPIFLAASAITRGASSAVMSNSRLWPPISSATLFRSSAIGGMSSTVTSAPSRASTRAMDAPMPREPPVTRAFLPASGLSQSKLCASKPAGPTRTTCADT